MQFSLSAEIVELRKKPEGTFCIQTAVHTKFHVVSQQIKSRRFLKHGDSVDLKTKSTASERLASRSVGKNCLLWFWLVGFCSTLCLQFVFPLELPEHKKTAGRKYRM